MYLCFNLGQDGCLHVCSSHGDKLRGIGKLQRAPGRQMEGTCRSGKWKHSMPQKLHISESALMTKITKKRIECIFHKNDRMHFTCDKIKKVYGIHYEIKYEIKYITCIISE